MLLPFRNHHVYCDNYFSSVDLFLDLQRKGTYACRTLRPNRKGFPEDLKPLTKKKQLERGEYKVRQCGNLTCTVWQDNKPVTVLATNADPTEEVSVPRKGEDGVRAPVPCPKATRLYNKFMGGVDLSDQLRGYYHLRLKGRKYYKYIVWFLIDLAITNAYVLCKNTLTYAKITTLKSFHSTLAKELIGTYCSRKRLGRPSTGAAPKRLKYTAHFPVKKYESGKKGGCCHYCYVYCNERRGESVWYCNTCKVHLCHKGRAKDCFLQYHRKTHVE